MSRMTNVQIGVIVFAICLSTQMVSLFNTSTVGVNFTSSNTTMAPGTYSSSPNTTSPGGAGVSLHPGTLSFLIPFIMASSLLQRYC